jgi:hypothetical protein
VPSDNQYPFSDPGPAELDMLSDDGKGRPRKRVSWQGADDMQARVTLFQKQKSGLLDQLENVDNGFRRNALENELALLEQDIRIASRLLTEYRARQTGLN